MSDPANMVPTQDELRLAIQVLGGPKAASRMLGCSDTLVRHWLAGRRLISAPKAQRLRDLIISVNSALPGIAYNLKVAAQHAETRLMQWRARRPRWQPARRDKPRLSPLERSERIWRDREIARRVADGETLGELAEEFGTSPRTVARRGSRQGKAGSARG
jgi:DNA-binding NarL/FixJ family response regulator